MSRSMRIQDLLSPSVTTSDGNRTQSRNSGLTPGSGCDRTITSNKQKQKPINHVQSKQPILNLLTWDLPPDEGLVVSRKKRKRTPEDVTLIRNPRRLPRFSVNVFNAEPANAYPIPYQGIVPRMIKYCKLSQCSCTYFALIVLGDVQTWAIEHGTALQIEGHPNPYHSLVFPYALHHGALFESMVCIARTSWLLQEGIPWQQDKALAYHRANAFATLGLRMTSENTCADDTTILTIAALSTFGDLLHPSKFDAFSYDQLWKFVKEQNEATAGLAQLAIDSPLRNELPVYSSPPFNTKVCEALSKVSPAFNDMAISGELSLQIIDILANLSSLIKDGTVSSPITSPRKSEKSRRNLLHSVIDLRYLSVMGITPIERYLCYGLIACSYTLHFKGGIMGEDHIESLQEVEEMMVGGDNLPLQDALVDAHGECLVWTFTAMSGALAMSENFSATSRLIDYAFDQFPDEMAQWKVLSKILQKFLWCENLLMFWRSIWHKAMVRRSGRDNHLKGAPS
ncbi:uncharacterized protein A1O9_00510 [Exophiala aquamarina CBS 119918]|uniref:Transcription factor domain-containing protein n=1 Tax=Exophiala aquamarina CBS 119918 TaxID=1182545 RepID=A0A072PRZ0_9EURO|nr:uncharacterized protein A1O9_00510 [Exophiala aquamarina CBS 119918]KEF62537.1 hypothetical protein A1O9_00510 [Exophiala aquamarina CBS 119918]